MFRPDFEHAHLRVVVGMGGWPCLFKVPVHIGNTTGVAVGGGGVD